VLIPIPGLFFAVGAAGSVGARWIAGKFITEDGEEHADIIPMGGVRSENDQDNLEEVTQNFDEDNPLKMYWNKFSDKMNEKKKKGPSTAQPAPVEVATDSLIELPGQEEEEEEEEEEGEEEEATVAGSWSQNIWSMISKNNSSNSSTNSETPAVVASDEEGKKKAVQEEPKEAAGAVEEKEGADDDRHCHQPPKQADSWAKSWWNSLKEGISDPSLSAAPAPAPVPVVVDKKPASTPTEDLLKMDSEMDLIKMDSTEDLLQLDQPNPEDDLMSASKPVDLLMFSTIEKEDDTPGESKPSSADLLMF
jgi:hypothetical protein